MSNAHDLAIFLIGLANFIALYFVLLLLRRIARVQERHSEALEALSGTTEEARYPLGRPFQGPRRR